MRRRGRVRGSRAGSDLAEFVRGLGAIAHFDPSWGVSDDGTLSRWTDRVGGHVVERNSATARLAWSASVAGLNGRPGWLGTYANDTALISTGSTLAEALDGSAACTVYCVKKPTAANPASTVAWMSIGSTSSVHYFYLADSYTGSKAVCGRADGSGTTFNTNSVVRPLATASVESAVYSGSAFSQWSNGGPSAVLEANARAPVCNRFCIGALYYNNGILTGTSFAGHIGDVIVFASAHDAPTRMAVEQMIARHYGWPVIQGISGFTTANYAKTANGLGLRGGASAMWFDVLLRPDATPTNDIPFGTYETNKGYLAYSNATYAANVANGTTVVASPGAAWGASDIGKLAFVGGSASGTAAFGFKNGAQIGASTALAGYQAAGASIPCSAGCNNGANPATSFSVFGAGGGDVNQVAADAAARAAAIKSEKRYVVTGGATPSHGWRYEGVASTYADLVGSDTMTTQGTLTAAQIIITEWPW